MHNYRKSGWLASLGIHFLFFFIISYSGFFAIAKNFSKTPDTEIYMADDKSSAENESNSAESSGSQASAASSSDIIIDRDSLQNTYNENSDSTTEVKKLKITNSTKKSPAGSNAEKGQLSSGKQGNAIGTGSEGNSSDTGTDSTAGTGESKGTNGGNSAENNESALKAAINPIPLNAPIPSYPYSMRSSGIEGMVTVSFSVDALGNVETVSVLSSYGGAAFIEAALTAARQWTFSPAQNSSGQPVRCIISQTFNFKMETVK
ncbi:energy transducer TonB [Pectinatus haikarae]|uniref:Protein TonB n=2 Tax=Pectinatus haikarae TaxID=349096 RepID=A0ABT9Y4I1_9FIRM|nr:energy transducer TonB [Pectinatus haikarae]MDQ0202732.1 protein TonB [Pectinatus haikarae]